MATKTFKIGLSNTDKQNMAQDVYERLLALTFPEYDTSTEYSVGDFVVYNDQLYKCIGATSGAWDSTKWQLATLNDLLTDIEDAVQFVNDKANVDGNYPTLTAGLADNLTPYNEDSGAEQDNPFISNGTGTNNNTEIVTVGDYGLLKEKQGNTVVVNQLNNNNGTTGTNADITYTKNNDGSWTLSGTASATSYRTIHTGISFVSGHKYLILTTKSNENVGFYVYNNEQQVYPLAPTYGNSLIFTSSYTLIANLVFIVKNATDLTTALTTKVYLIDLTQMFNGDIPSDLLSHPENFFRYYQGDLSYNTGSLETANGVRLVSTKRNLVNPSTITEDKVISYVSGTEVSASGWGSHSDYIVVSPNKPLYLRNVFGNSLYACIIFFDINKQFIDSASISGSSTQVSGVVNVPANAIYAIINFAKTATEIDVSLYYTPEEGGKGYNKHYDYEEPYIVDTGTEVLRSAGSVKNYKTPNGVVHRLVGSVDLGTLDFASITGENSQILFQCQNVLPNLKYETNNEYVANLTSIYKVITANEQWTSTENMTISITENGYISIRNSSYNDVIAFKTAMSGVILNYELAEPTTEQGTPFAENLPINDYGMLYWLDSSNNLVGIPQGAKIFYPVNYKGFLDDLYSKVDGNSDDYALNSELNAKFETYLKSLSGYDATATQVLKNVEGTLTWVTEGE